MNRKKKVMVGMSGGVDSSAAAVMLLERGYDVAGGTFRIWDSIGTSDLDDARAVCAKLNIPHYAFDWREEFCSGVVEHFAQGYENGSTPNPCILCNRVIKFGVLLQKALDLGFDLISTGHYANVEYDEKLGRFRIRKSIFDKKDQSYVLYSLTQEQLKRAILPLGDFDKPQIRELALQNHLPVGHKSESQDICFIPDGKYADFLTGYLGKASEPGDFIDAQGNILGRHKGIRHYTIGQRKGLGLSFAHPMFVADIDKQSNTVTLAENEALMRDRLTVTNTNWIDFDRLEKPARVSVKVRYSAVPAGATVTPAGEASAEVVFDTPQRAITPGQSAVFYDGDYLIGGGIIDKAPR